MNRFYSHFIGCDIFEYIHCSKMIFCLATIMKLINDDSFLILKDKIEIVKTFSRINKLAGGIFSIHSNVCFIFLLLRFEFDLSYTNHILKVQCIWHVLEMLNRDPKIQIMWWSDKIFLIYITRNNIIQVVFNLGIF